MTFREYVATRRYHFGRGTQASWEFLTYALGREEILAATSLAELRELLVAAGASEHLQRGARSAWRSYSHWKWRRPSRGARR
jgi:hypothetical protein